MSTRSLVVRSLLAVAPVGLLFVVADLAGCTSTTPAPATQSMADRQDQAINDPMNYKPPVERSIDGGSIGTFDRKSVGQDMNDLLNP